MNTESCVMGERHRGRLDSGRSATAVRINRVHRSGAAALGGFLWVFGILGLANRFPFLTAGGQVFGLATNGALSMLSLVAGAVLLLAALRSGRASSTVTALVGALFLLSGLVHLMIIDTPWNILSFRLSNVFFSLAAGILLIGVGAYGRYAGHKFPDNPYRHRHDEDDNAEHLNASDDPDLADAEQAIAADAATPEQQRKVRTDAILRQAHEYQHAWANFANGHSGDEIAALRELEQRESSHPERNQSPKPNLR
jgi:hypothetical protein